MSTNDDGIYKVDTVPPPQGEDDAYSAPTRVGVMASAIVGELLAQGDRSPEPPKERANEPAPTPRRSIPPPAAALAEPDEPAEDAAPIKSPLEVEAASSDDAEEKDEDEDEDEDAAASEDAKEPAKETAAAKTAATTAAEDASGSKLPMYVLAAALIAVVLYLLAR